MSDKRELTPYALLLLAFVAYVGYCVLQYLTGGGK